MKRSLRKGIMLIIAVMTLSVCFVFGASAETEYTEGYYTYVVNEFTDGKAVITHVEENISGDVVIPDTLGGYEVCGIESGSFDECEKITSITIPDSVTSIAHSAFSGCSSLTSFSVDLNNEVYFNDKNGVLYGCFDDNKPFLLKYPEGNTENNYEILDDTDYIIGDAFEDCVNLKDILIPDSVTDIGEGAFNGCTNLSSIMIPDGVTSIKMDVFRWCTNLTSITIPDSVTYIGLCAFEGCTSLTDITIPDSVTSIYGRAFKDCTSLTDITIPDSVTYIESYAFEGCTSLTDITIPDSVTSIGNSAFEGCTSLTDITIPDVIELGEKVFYNTGYYNDYDNWENTALYIDKILIEIDISKDIIKEGTKTIAGYAIYGNNSHIILPEGMENINYNAFRNSYGPFCVYVPNSLKKISSYSFVTAGTSQGIPIPEENFNGDSWMWNSNVSVYFAGTEEEWKLLNNDREYGIYKITYAYTLNNHEHNFINSSIPVGYEQNPCETPYYEELSCECGWSDFIYIETPIGEHCLDFDNPEYLEPPCAGGDYGYVMVAVWCKNCRNHKIEYEIPSVEHTFGAWIYNPFPCQLEEGTVITREHICEFCRYCESEEYVVTDSKHSMSEWELTAESTCGKAGKETRYCTYGCGYSESRDLETVPHSMGEWSVDYDSTCSAYGQKSRYCLNNCGYRESEQIEKTEHNMSSWTVDWAADCYSKGRESRYCLNNCGHHEYNEIPVINHSMSVWSEDYPASCTDTGRESRYCTHNCGYIEYKEIPVTDHSMSGWTEMYPATCTETGMQYKKCQHCDYTEYKEIGKTGHRDTNADGICDSCGENIAVANCSCNCHKGGFSGFFWKILRIFYKLFKTKEFCACGVAHY